MATISVRVAKVSADDFDTVFALRDLLDEIEDQSPDPEESEQRILAQWRNSSGALTRVLLAADALLSSKILDESVDYLKFRDGLVVIEESAAATADDLDKLRVELLEAQHAVGEGWFAGGCTLAEAIERKTRALEALPEPATCKRCLQVAGESEDFFGDGDVERAPEDIFGEG